MCANAFGATLAARGENEANWEDAVDPGPPRELQQQHTLPHLSKQICSTIETAAAELKFMSRTLEPVPGLAIHQRPTHPYFARIYIENLEET